MSIIIVDLPLSHTHRHVTFSIGPEFAGTEWI